MFQLLTAVLMGWISMFFYMQWKPLKAIAGDDGTYVYIKDAARGYLLLSAFTIGSWAFLEYVVKWVNG